LFQKAITKDAVNQLELGKYQGPIYLINKEEQIEQAFEEILSEEVVGIDTEARPAFKKGQYNPVALVQIATSKSVFLIRTKDLGMPDQMVEFFNSDRITKVGIALRDDISDLKRLRPVEPQNLFDLNVYCASLGFENIGARNLTAMILGFRISKSQQVSDWEAEKLSPQQMDYAATDAWVCREIYYQLKSVYNWLQPAGQDHLFLEFLNVSVQVERLNVNNVNSNSGLFSILINAIPAKGAFRSKQFTFNKVPN